MDVVLFYPFDHVYNAVTHIYTHVLRRSPYLYINSSDGGFISGFIS